MKISLITVCYNSESTLKETMQSVQSQTIAGFELEYLVIDGASKDKTASIVEEFSNIVSVFISEPDTGIYNAMNKGLSIATGDVVGFLNSDDTFASNDVLVNICNTFTQRGVDYVYGNLCYTNLLGEVKRQWRTGFQRSFIHGWHPPHPAFYASMSMFEKLGNFDEDFRIASDFELMLRFCEAPTSNGVYLNIQMVHMKLGGVSNNSYKSILIGAKEIFDAFHKNGKRPSPIYFLQRYTKNLFQYLKL